MKLIAAVDNEWNIGNKGGLLFSLPDDMKFFRTTTSGKIVVMGRKTLESFPGSKPLKNRVNIVLSRCNRHVDGAEFVTGVDELLDKLKEYDSRQSLSQPLLFFDQSPYIFRTVIEPSLDSSSNILSIYFADTFSESISIAYLLEISLDISSI